jgi:hypothetical protein
MTDKAAARRALAAASVLDISRRAKRTNAIHS